MPTAMRAVQKQAHKILSHRVPRGPSSLIMVQRQREAVGPPVPLPPSHRHLSSQPPERSCRKKRQKRNRGQKQDRQIKRNV